MFLSPRALKSLKSIKRTQPRIMWATLNDNTCTVIVSSYSPNDASDITTFYNGLSSLDWHIPKHNVLIIGGNMNHRVSKDENDEFCLHNMSSKNCEYLADFLIKNWWAGRNNNSPLQKKKKKKKKKRYGSTRTQITLYYILINKKWINNALNCETHFFSDGVFSDRRIDSAKPESTKK